jgi:hypothetical protein
MQEVPMHGLIFATWENYLGERFGGAFLSAYRVALGQTRASALLADRVYPDEQLLHGVALAQKLSNLPLDTLLRDYGYFFLINGLTSHRCAYLLNEVRDGRALMLVMRQAHLHIGQTGEAITPPLFEYESLPGRPNALILIYDSPRKLCPVLLGAIEGAAARYGQEVRVQEQQCMRKGAAACRFAIEFSAPTSQSRTTGLLPGEEARWQEQRQLAELVYSVLLDNKALSLTEIQMRLGHQLRPSRELRLYRVLEALRHLQHAGWVASTADQPRDTLSNRRYWRLNHA